MFSRLIRAALLAATPLSVSAAPVPANDAQRGLAALQAMDARVAAVGERLAVRGAPLCGDRQMRSGLLVHGLAQYAPAARADAAALFGLGDAPAVLAVVPGSGADRAGLQAGDAIIAVEGDDVATATAPQGAARFDAVQRVEDRIEAGLADGALSLTIRRDGRERAVRVTGDEGCASRFQMIPATRLNASAGPYVSVTSAIVEFVASDDELALVLAHELSHNILKHGARLDRQGTSRGLLRAFGKNPGRIRATEDEADRMALYLMARAGYDIAVAPAFWDRFGRRTGFGMFSDRTHSGRRDRMALAVREIALIRAQQARGEAPTPDFAGR
ncbi:MAG: hypothetical protein ABS87_00735 [Sphingomonas sp. SCN 67-18]|uniref:M48 family metallopeptidase n=1 Tax=uncultured Sphingomonas sp. TaxID=158754 RepID=UPI00086DC684|nr:M48 family metallopeptidase [Sphingomonas sp. SCN 67-18]ODU22729.1 MAG: hypothetical protein ABS87_00735 [Sphingomonas sp. SCN 67-18]